MPRANRHYIPGHIWHITHRCHKREFLMKFSKDKKWWLFWLFEVKKRFGLCILNYIVISNHIHLLVLDTEDDVIPKSIQLVAGRTGQEFSARKKRKGVFWDDRYHVTAVDSHRHIDRLHGLYDVWHMIYRVRSKITYHFWGQFNLSDCVIKT